jgi:hypothetical protein
VGPVPFIFAKLLTKESKFLSPIAFSMLTRAADHPPFVSLFLTQKAAREAAFFLAGDGQ